MDDQDRRPDRFAPRLPHLDGWRGLAILLVLIGHFCPSDRWSAGSLGVELFFVLSGRLVGHLLFRTEVDAKTFIVRRLSRTYPTLLVVVLTVGPLHALLGLSVPSFLPPLTFTANEVYAASKEPLFFGHLWSLCVEEQSYALLLIVALLARRKLIGPAWTCALLAAIFMATLALVPAHPGSDYTVLWRTETRAGALVGSAGLALALASHRSRLSRLRGWSIVPVAAFVIGVLLFIDPMPNGLRYTVGSLCLAVSVNTIDGATGGVLKGLAWPPLTLLGAGSYSLYLWQQPFYKLSLLLHGSALALLALATAVAFVSFVTVERPCRRALNRWWDARAATASAPTRIELTAARSRPGL